jgi:hypothetical protein
MGKLSAEQVQKSSSITTGVKVIIDHNRFKSHHRSQPVQKSSSITTGSKVTEIIIDHNRFNIIDWQGGTGGSMPPRYEDTNTT